MQTAIETPDVPKKKQAKPKSAPDTSWLERAKKPVVVQVRGSEAYKGWIDRLTKFDKRPISDLTELAIERYAASIGFDEKPPER